MTPILIVIPYWHQDKEQARELCKIITGMQPHHVGTAAHVLLVSRQDCPMDNDMVKLVSTKFHTYTFTSNSPLRGWPSGSNGMFGSTMIHINGTSKSKYECVFWMEPDCIPLCPNWFWDLVKEWRKKHPKAYIVGCRADCNGNGTGDHITGCALYHPNIAKILPEITHSDKVAWDYEHRAKIVAMGGSINCIENWYKATDVPYGIVDRVNVGVCLIHGVKGMSLVNHVKKKYNIF